MRRAIKYTSNLYTFLEAKGVLAIGDPFAITEAKKEYWAQYKKEWKKTKRHENKSFTILLSFHEAKEVAKKAVKFHTSTTNYIKQSALSSKNIIDKIALGEIRQLLFQQYNLVNALIEKNIVPNTYGSDILIQIEQIEQKIFSCLEPK